jgi:protein TonB
MRMIPALVGSLLITLAVFLFMRSLIQQGAEADLQPTVYTDVQILHSQPEEPPPQSQPPDTAPEPTEVEPTMEPLAVSAVAAPSPVPPAAALEIPALELDAGDISVAAAGDRWSAPLRSGSGGAGGEVMVGGMDAQGYIEVVPFDTRRPNVPLVAWQNKIDGWVLAAFSVTPEGRTRDVRVLDASPRGVFEDAVIAAIEDWRYHISFSGEARGDVVLTQKVEVLWKNYPQNLPNVD